MQSEIKAQINKTGAEVRSSYEKEVDITLDKLSKPATVAMDHLDSVVQKFEKNFEDLGELKLLVPQIANSLPFSSKRPHLRGTKPHYLILDGFKTSSLITFEGNFPCSAKPGFEPTFIFGGRHSILLNSTTGSLTFRVSHEAFKELKADHCSYRTGILHIPWDDGRFWSHKTEFVYQISLTALPQLAGNGYVEYSSKKTHRVIKHVKTVNFLFDGTEWCPEEWHDVEKKIHPEPGWTIDIDTKPRMMIKHEHGRHTQEIISHTDDEIVLKVSLYCRAGEIGIVQVAVEFYQYQDQTFDDKHREEFHLNWRDSKLLEPHSNEIISKVSFTDYKGIHQEFAAPNLDSSVLKLGAEGTDKWKIWAEPPRE